MESSDTGPIIAGLLGLLVLGGVFGRRKNGLPEVVS
ncbi:LPXTG cell wall anchor domain-containing protein [Sandarakinorhabdus limnophila]|jgi:MYXO-CTERM domain-containing protein